MSSQSVQKYHGSHFWSKPSYGFYIRRYNGCPIDCIDYLTTGELIPLCQLQYLMVANYGQSWSAGEGELAPEQTVHSGPNFILKFSAIWQHFPISSNIILAILEDMELGPLIFSTIQCFSNDCRA